MTKRGWVVGSLGRGLLLVATLFLLLISACGQPQVTFTGGCKPPRPDWVDVPADMLSGQVTFCDDDAYVGQIESTTYPPGTERVDVMLSGYPQTEGMRLDILYPLNGKTKRIHLDVHDVGDGWALRRLEIPERASRAGFKLRLLDDARATYGWAGIGQVNPSAWRSTLPSASLLLLVALACHAWLCALAFGLPRSLSASSRLVGALLSLGLASFVAFLIYLTRPVLGFVGSVLLLLAPLVLLALVWRRRDQPWADLQVFHRRMLPTLLLTLVVLWVGLFPFTWNGSDWFVPAERWREMPGDNWLSLVFAKMLVRGVIDHPMEGDWLSSDRPPLQTGLSLIFHPLMRSQPGLVYQACATWAQLTFLLPLSLLLPVGKTEGEQHRQAALLCLLGLSPLLFLNGLFVWPKLFAGTFCAIFHLLLFSDDAPERKHRRDYWAGAAAGFVLLSHGGAICALFGSTLALLIQRRRAVLPRLLRIAPVTALLLVPWILYQRLLDPPGDRLLKWHFAGQIDVTPEPFAQTFVYAYKNLSFSGWVHNRVANVQTIFNGSLSFGRDLWDLLSSPDGSIARQTLKRMIDSGFYYPVYNAWFFGPLALLLVLLVGARNKQLRWSLWPRGLWLATALGLLVWVFVMFLPSSTIVHQGAYFTVVAIPLLVMLAAVQLTPRLFSVLAMLQGLVFLTLYVYDRPFTEVSRPWLYALGSLLLLFVYFRACRRAVVSELGELV